MADCLSAISVGRANRYHVSSSSALPSDSNLSATLHPLSLQWRRPGKRNSAPRWQRSAAATGHCFAPFERNGQRAVARECRRVGLLQRRQCQLRGILRLARAALWARPGPQMAVQLCLPLLPLLPLLTMQPKPRKNNSSAKLSLMMTLRLLLLLVKRRWRRSRGCAQAAKCGRHNCRLPGHWFCSRLRCHQQPVMATTTCRWCSRGPDHQLAVVARARAGARAGSDSREM